MMNTFVDSGETAPHYTRREAQLRNSPPENYVDPGIRRASRLAGLPISAFYASESGNYQRLNPAIKLNKPADNPAQASNPQQDPTGQLLYIEDNDTNLRLVELVVQRFSELEFVAAHNGASGLQLAHQQAVKVILLDLHLPDMRGEEILRRLKADPATRPIPVVVISADNMLDHIDVLQAAGAFGYIAKPIDLKLFQVMLNDIAALEIRD